MKALRAALLPPMRALRGLPAVPWPVGRGGPARRSVLVGLIGLVGLLAAAGPSSADDDDHDRARAAVQAGQVLPLKTVLELLARDHPGQVLEVELEHDDGRWVYEIKLLQPGGRLAKLEVDAATGALLRRKERGPRGGGR